MKPIDTTRQALRALDAYAVPSADATPVKLDANEFPFDLPLDIRKELGAALADVAINRYPPPDAGTLRELLCREQGCSSDELVLGNGSDELIHLLCSTFAEARPGQSQAGVLYPVPTFSVFRTAAAGSGCRSIEVPLGPRFHIDFETTRAAIRRESPNLVFIARPNNPTGYEWPLESFLECVRAFPSVIFISDEAYADYGGATALGSWRDLPNLMVMRTLSKIGLAGLRIGTLSGPAELCREVEKIRSPYNIGVLNLAAAILLLSKHREWFRKSCQEVVVERARVQDALIAHGYDVFPSTANFLLFRRAAGAQPLWEHLRKQGVLVRNLDAPGAMAGCLRVTIGTRADNDAFLGALAAFG